MTHQTDLRQREGDQPLPSPNGHPDVQSLVIADLTARRELGIRRYGTALQPFNGRSALLDLYEELLDAACYTRQRLAEESTRRPAAEIVDSTDAMVWAEEFAKTISAGCDPTDLGFLVGWFANALETGKRHHPAAIAERAEAVGRVLGD